MHSAIIASLFTAFVAVGVVADDPTTGQLGNATVVEDNPPLVEYQATLPDTAWDKNAYPNGGNIKGSVSAVASSDGIGVNFAVRFSGLPSNFTGFLYHIHVEPVPADGNCTKTLAHLDPFIRGENPSCNGSLPQTCQVGDLSGKHGKITSDPFTANYTDYFASTKDGLGAFFGNRSLVVHFPNTTRITCANFTKIDYNESTVSTVIGTTTTSSATSTGNSSSTSTSTSTSTTSPISVNVAPATRLTGASLMVVLLAVTIALVL